MKKKNKANLISGTKKKNPEFGTSGQHKEAGQGRKGTGQNIVASSLERRGHSEQDPSLGRLGEDPMAPCIFTFPEKESKLESRAHASGFPKQNSEARRQAHPSRHGV